MCLRLNGEERPTMKEVEMALQTIKTKRLKSYRVPPLTIKDPHQLIYSRPRDIIDQSFPLEDFGLCQPNTRCYSLEQEFISSTDIPR
jgi:hypothetical protein